ncbi:sensor histidine kinase [Alkalihalobacillus sp. 1P02AB]|uniref:sensor histidine kinase n=1 Tax=Alkalihalobacillus sp. 1P02AB TaxID=3132260 RepID=UPI0039A500C8
MKFRLSLKLGLMFFVIILGLELTMVFFLHNVLVDSRIEDEVSSLLARGHSHQLTLEHSFDEETIYHVTLMEVAANTDVIVTNGAQQVLSSSFPNQWIEEAFLQSFTFDSVPRKGLILNDDINSFSYINTVHEIINERSETIGYVYMFLSTDSLHAVIHQLNEHFWLTAVIVISLTTIIIFILSVNIVKPLLKMKEATVKMSNGDFSVSLPNTRKDELGDLARSIQTLAHDLDYLKKERNEFLATIAHELRTPLTYIKGYADVVQKRKLSAKDEDKYLKIIHEESEKLTELIDDLFDLAKLDQNQFVIKKEMIHLVDFLEQIQLKMEPAFYEKKMSLTVQCPNQLSLSADPRRLEQIVVNLLDNSIHYSNSGSEVMIAVSAVHNGLFMEIIDNGQGIPASDIPHIMDKFYRVEKARTRKYGGSGLGLAIVKELMNAHGGDISIQSKENKGTTIQLFFKDEKNETNFITN